jgi:hypothetical protein
MRVLWIALVGSGPQLQNAYALDSVLEDLVYTLACAVACLVVALGGRDALRSGSGSGELAGWAPGQREPPSARTNSTSLPSGR